MDATHIMDKKFIVIRRTHAKYLAILQTTHVFCKCIAVFRDEDFSFGSCHWGCVCLATRVQSQGDNN